MWLKKKFDFFLCFIKKKLTVEIWKENAFFFFKNKNSGQEISIANQNWKLRKIKFNLTNFLRKVWKKTQQFEFYQQQQAQANTNR